jgi:hypothetical protein
MNLDGAVQKFGTKTEKKKKKKKKKKKRRRCRTMDRAYPSGS